MYIQVFTKSKNILTVCLFYKYYLCLYVQSIVFQHTGLSSQETSPLLVNGQIVGHIDRQIDGQIFIFIELSCY